MESIPLPTGLAASNLQPHPDYSDCYAAIWQHDIACPTPSQVARVFFSSAIPDWLRKPSESGPAWTAVQPLDRSLAVLGERIGPWTVVYSSDSEIVLHDKAPGLDFLFSIRIASLGQFASVEASTLVRYRSGIGRAYFFFVKPLHKLIVPRYMSRVIRVLRSGK